MRNNQIDNRRKALPVIRVQRVLCPVDLSEPSIRSLTYAVAVAKWYEGGVTALHVVPTFDAVEVPSGALFDPVRILYVMSREEVLEQLRETLNRAGIAMDNVTLAVEAGEPVATIVDQSVARQADLLVMGTHGRSGFDRLVLGSVTEKALRKAPCPVLTVPPHVPGASAPVAFSTIMCAVDFSPASLQAVGFALDLARHANARVIALYAIEWLAEEQPGDHVEFNVPSFRQHLTHNTEERLQALLAKEVPVERGWVTKVVTGRAHREILRVAKEEHADLIVMGAQGRGGPALTLFGSTTEQVVRAAACPVLTVRAPIS